MTFRVQLMLRDRMKCIISDSLDHGGGHNIKLIGCVDFQCICEQDILVKIK